MRDIAYNHNDEIKTMSAAEIAAGEAHFFRSAYLMEDINRVTKERMKETMERVGGRPAPTEAKPVEVLWHVARATIPVPCDGAHTHNTVSLQNFTNKMKGNVNLCVDCKNYVHNVRHERNRAKRKHVASKFFDKRKDAAFPIDLPLK